MTIRELKDQEKAFSAAHADTTEVVMEINKRFSLPLASFVFAWWEPPWAYRNRGPRPPSDSDFL